jgi:hypothetical protein
MLSPGVPEKGVHLRHENNKLDFMTHALNEAP